MVGHERDLAYRLYQPMDDSRKDKVIVSRDVISDKSTFPNLNREFNSIDSILNNSPHLDDEKAISSEEDDLEVRNISANIPEIHNNESIDASYERKPTEVYA